MIEGPYRRYTELSARTLACYLASLDNAESGLCRNVPKVPSEFPSQDSMRRPRRPRHTHNGIGEHNAPPGHYQGTDEMIPAGQVPLGRDSHPTHLAGVPENRYMPHFDVHAQGGSSLDHGNPQTRRMKDPKSFTQNLFDTLSLRMVEWLPLRRSMDTFESEPDHSSIPQAVAQSPRLESPQRQTHASTERSHSNHDRTIGSNLSGKGAPKTPSSRIISGQPAAVELKLPSQHLKRLSFTEVDSWRQSPRPTPEEKTRSERKPTRTLSINACSESNEFVSMPSPPALKHRPQKHRGKVIDANGVIRSQHKTQRRVSWDGSKILNDAQRRETQKSRQVPRDRPAAEAVSHDSKSKRKDKHRQYSASQSIQTVAHLTSDIIDGLGQIMVQSDEEAQRWKDELSCMELAGSFDDPEWQFATPRQQQVFAFVAQSVFYVLSSTRQILRSFRENSTSTNERKQRSVNARLDLPQLQTSFRRLFDICPWDIALQSIWGALEKLFIPPKELSITVKHSRRPSRSSTSISPVSNPVSQHREFEGVMGEHISDDNAAYVATVALFALVSSLPEVDTQTWRGILQMRSAGTLAPDAEMRNLSSIKSQLIVRVTDKLEHELALRLVSRFVRALTARLAFHEISKTRRVYTQDSPKQRRPSVLDLILDNLSEHHSLVTAGSGSPPLTKFPGPSAIIVEWLRTLLLREWDGNPEMARSSAAGGAVQILASMYKERNRLGLVPEDFHTPFLSERLDPMEMPVDWLNRSPNNKTIHLLSYSFLFPPSALVTYFRAVNHSTMSKYYEAAMTTTRHVTQTAFSAIHVSDDVGLLARMKTSMSTYLVLMVSRDHVLTDALNQLWRRERRELMRPLKVQMGIDEGEEGVDHGGVQQEFFRVAMAEALNPSYGMFTTDSRTRISWFQPCSMEPLYKFELLGLLMSIAVYNGLTLPINFPTALYRKLLGLKVKHLDHVRDGWPDLTRGLEELLKWKDGDVGDIFIRTYEFSFEAFGSVRTVDMQRIDRDAVWPVPSEYAQKKDHSTVSVEGTPGSQPEMVAEMVDSSLDGEANKKRDNAVPSQSPTPTADEEEEEAPLVTNQNRHQFVKDYIFWLTDKSVRSQYEAFARGFYTCLDRSALSIFTPEALKSVVEGIQEIDMRELERFARYEGGFGPTHRVIRDFWSIARRFSPEKRARLLEFVTASDRVPVNGISSIMFVIQKNGMGDAVSFIISTLLVRCSYANNPPQRLPTSLTCFGRLLLPEYSSKSVLEEKLSKALENSRGFGVA